MKENKTLYFFLILYNRHYYYYSIIIKYEYLKIQPVTHMRIHISLTKYFTTWVTQDKKIQNKKKNIN